MPRLYVEQVERIAATAPGSRPDVWSDGRWRLRRRRVSYAGNCSSPVTVELHSRPSAKGNRKHVVLPHEGQAMTVEIEARCRACENCLKKRAAHWRLRARAEIASSVRTWFVTLTVQPTRRFLVLTEARAALHRQGLDFETLDPDDQFYELHKVHSAEITRWLKRVRTNSAAPIRFLCVAESHADGYPHYHVLIHEPDPARPVRKSVIQDAWTWGFSNAKLVADARAASYATKYLTKSARARVRGSVRYGEPGGLATLPSQTHLRSEEKERRGELTTTMTATANVDEISGPESVEEIYRREQLSGSLPQPRPQDATGASSGASRPSTEAGAAT